MPQSFKAPASRLNALPRFIALTVVIFAVAPACNFSTHPGYTCQGTYVPAISASVTDSVTGANIVNGSTLIVKDAGYVDSTTFVVGGKLVAARDRPGTYDVTVRRNGYQPYQRNGVAVVMDADGCHAVTEHIEARLQPVI